MLESFLSSIVVVSFGKLSDADALQGVFFPLRSVATINYQPLVAAVSKQMLQIIRGNHVNTFRNTCFYFFPSLRLDFSLKRFQL